MNPANTLFNTINPPQVIFDKFEELNQLIEQNPVLITLEKAADFIGISAPTLQELLFEGRCPFGMQMKKSTHRRPYNVIPSFNFYMWQTQWSLIWLMLMRDEENFMQKGIF